jgi:hypothetical protein
MRLQTAFRSPDTFCDLNPVVHRHANRLP